MKRVTLILMLVVLCFPTLVSAEERFIVGIKQHVGYGLMGPEIEREFVNRWSVSCGYGKKGELAGVTLGLKRYLGSSGQRAYLGGFVTLTYDEGMEVSQPFASIGYQWIWGRVCLSVEAGLGLFLIPKSLWGVGVGIMF